MMTMEQQSQAQLIEQARQTAKRVERLSRQLTEEAEQLAKELGLPIDEGGNDARRES